MGAAYVMRAASSKGAADLGVWWPTEYAPIGASYSWLVQTKYSINGKAYLPAAEADELRRIAELTGALPVFARPGKNGRGVEFINLHTKEPIGSIT